MDEHTVLKTAAGKTVKSSILFFSAKNIVVDKKKRSNRVTLLVPACAYFFVSTSLGKGH